MSIKSVPDCRVRLDTHLQTTEAKSEHWVPRRIRDACSRRQARLPFASVSLYMRDVAEGVQHFSWLAAGSQGRRTSRLCRFIGITSEGFDAVSRSRQSVGEASAI